MDKVTFCPAVHLCWQKPGAVLCKRGNILCITILTKGNISRSLLLFALPMMAGNLLQQFYNIADTLIVGRV
ncbi:MAG: hypothetical protein V8R59_09885, partial [Enterocloster sp.]